MFPLFYSKSKIKLKNVKINAEYCLISGTQIILTNKDKDEICVCCLDSGCAGGNTDGYR